MARSPRLGKFHLSWWIKQLWRHVCGDIGQSINSQTCSTGTPLDWETARFLRLWRRINSNSASHAKETVPTKPTRQTRLFFKTSRQSKTAMPLDSIQHSKTYFLGKMKKFRESRFQIKQSPSVMYFAFFRTYYLRKTQKFSFDRRFVLQKASQDTFAFLSTNYQRNFRKFSDNRFFFPLGKISTESTN